MKKYSLRIDTNMGLMILKGCNTKFNEIVVVPASKLGSLRSTTRQLHDALSIYMIRKRFFGI